MTNAQAKSVLDALVEKHGTTTQAAAILGVNTRTLERWRDGHMPKPGSRRRETFERRFAVVRK